MLWGLFKKVLRDKSVIYSDELVGFARGNLKVFGPFKTFAECVIFGFFIYEMLNKMGFYFLLSFQVYFI